MNASKASPQVPNVRSQLEIPLPTPATPATKRCPQCGIWSSEPLSERTTCMQCGFRFCRECYHYRHQLGSDFCFACGAWFINQESRWLPPLPAYLERQLARLISLVNLWFVLWLGLAFSGTDPWLYLLVCGGLAGYWSTHYLRFCRRTGLVQAARYLGGIGLGIVLTMSLLVVLQFWLVRPPINWQSIRLWAFVLTTLVVVPVGVLLPPVILQARLGAQIVAEAQAHSQRWLALENIGYLDTLLLRIPDVRHL